MSTDKAEQRARKTIAAMDESDLRAEAEGIIGEDRVPRHALEQFVFQYTNREQPEDTADALEGAGYPSIADDLRDGNSVEVIIDRASHILSGNELEVVLGILNEETGAKS